jgi:ketosteroid isomerase-like protein
MNKATTNNNDLHGFEQFMKQREEAASAYVNGDAALVGALLTQDAPSSFFGPMGGHIEGAKKVWATHEHGAEQFQTGGENKLEILHMGASDCIAYWVGLQHATVHIGKSAKATPMSLRVTELFRREGGEWKLIHRHADMLASSLQDKKETKES